MRTEWQFLPEHLIPGSPNLWMNAAGFMGYIPPASWEWLSRVGVFVTNPISFNPRSPTRHRDVIHFPGGFLLHTGFPNDGFTKTIKKYQQKWSRSTLPIWIHLLADTPSNINKMVRILEELDNVSAIELGLPVNGDHVEQIKLVNAALGELPLYVNLPLNKIEPEFVNLLLTLGVEGIVLSAPRGCVAFGGRLVSGRLYGPALFPQTTQTIIDLKGIGLPVIAGSGVFTIEQAETALATGASAVQFDGLLWQI